MRSNVSTITRCSKSLSGMKVTKEIIYLSSTEQLKKKKKKFEMFNVFCCTKAIIECYGMCSQPGRLLQALNRLGQVHSTLIIIRASCHTDLVQDVLNLLSF